MRTTVEIDDDVLSAVRSLAHAKQQSIGATLSSLARRGLAPPTSASQGVGGFPVFDVPPGGHLITSEAVRAALDEEP